MKEQTKKKIFLINIFKNILIRGKNECFFFNSKNLTKNLSNIKNDRFNESRVEVEARNTIF